MHLAQAAQCLEQTPLMILLKQMLISQVSQQKQYTCVLLKELNALKKTPLMMMLQTDAH